jgi:hypothetical protein
LGNSDDGLRRMLSLYLRAGQIADYLLYLLNVWFMEGVQTASGE